MVSMKIVLVLVLVAAIACEATHHRNGGKVKLRARHRRGKTGVKVAVKGGLGGGLGYLFKGLSKHLKFHQGLLSSLLNLRAPSTIDDLLGFVLQLALGFSKSVDLWLPGLGDFLSKLFAALIRLLACVLNLFGNNRGFCKRGYFKDYLGLNLDGLLDVGDLLKKLRLQSPRDDLGVFIKKASKGKGLEALLGPRRSIFDLILKAIAILNKGKNIVKTDLTIIIDIVLKLVLTVGNSFSKGLGNQCISDDNTLGIISNILAKQGCPRLDDRKRDIASIISKADDDDANLPWDLDDDDDDDDDDLDDRAGNDDKDKKDRKNNDNDNDDDDDKKKNKELGTTPLTKNLGILIYPIFNRRGKVYVSKGVLNNILNSTVIKTLEDVASLLANVSILIASILDTLLKGLGSFFGRTCLFIPRVTLCINGKNYDGYCGRNFVKEYGIDGKATTIDDLRTLFQISQAKKQLLDIIQKKTNGKGIEGIAKKAIKAVLKSVLKIVTICDNIQDNKDAFNQFYIELIKIIAIVGNSYDRKNHKLGSNLVNQFSENCDGIIKQHGWSNTVADNAAAIKQNSDDVSIDDSFQVCVNTTYTVTITKRIEVEEEVEEDSE